jgi:threonine dehydratase
MIVAEIAEKRLTPKAKAAVADLLRGQTFADVSNWADSIKGQAEWVQSKPWHFVDIPDGQTYDTTFAAAQKFCAQQGSIFIPPFDDFDIIAGQATVGLEIAEQITEPLDFIFLAIGGGGLAAGTCLSLGALSPETQIIGVEPEAAASMTASLDAGHVVELGTIDKFVDGASVKRVGDITFPICAKGLSDVVLISKSAVCQAMLDLYAMDSMIVEPAGALSIAALPKYAEKIKGKSVICVISGGNFDPKRFPEIKQAALYPH